MDYSLDIFVVVIAYINKLFSFLLELRDTWQLSLGEVTTGDNH